MNPSSRRNFIKAIVANAAVAGLARIPMHAADSAPSGPAGKTQGDNKEPIERTVLRGATKLAPKNSEATAVNLADGGILIIWTEFIDLDLLPPDQRPPFSAKRRGVLGDDGYARLSGVVSRDGGRTWSEPRVYVDDADASVNCMHPSLARLKDGRLMLAYTWRNGGIASDNRGETARRARFSSNEGLTWSEPVRISPVGTNNHSGCHDRALVLNSGRILLQCHVTDDTSGPTVHKRTFVARSDDGGANWLLSNELTESRSIGLNEGTLVARADGSLLMLMRSTLGQLFSSVSRDDGVSWSPARPSGIVAGDACARLARIPNSSSLLLIWNPNFNPRKSQDLQVSGPNQATRTVKMAGRAVSRCPLLCAISEDGGASWGLPKVLEDDFNYEWAYPGILFHGNRALIHYHRVSQFAPGRDLMLTQVPIDWLTANA